MCKGNDVVKT